MEAVMAEENENETTDNEEEDHTPSPEEIRKMQAALKKANKEAENYRKKAQEFEDAAKTEDEKRLEKLAAAEKDAAAARAESLRLRVGLKYNLDDDLVDRLKGATLEEIEEDAKKLSEKFKTGRKAATSFDQGGRESPPADKSDMNSTIAGLVGRRR